MIRAIALAIALCLLLGCGDEDKSKYNPDEAHSVSKDGARHMPGLQDPLTSCSACHGTDLKGGTSGVSCFECHGEKW